MGSEHDEWLQHENARRKAEHAHLMELMKHSKTDPSKEALEKKRKDKASEEKKEDDEDDTGGKWSQPTDDDEYFD